jgi:hypothetical protein
MSHLHNSQRFEAPRFEDDAEALHIAAFIGERLDATSEYLALRESYAELRRAGRQDRADALAGDAPRLLHRLARAGLLAAPRAA